MKDNEIQQNLSSGQISLHNYKAPHHHLQGRLKERVRMHTLTGVFQCNPHVTSSIKGTPNKPFS